jgi:AcrR family transcriptional regulator
VESDVTNDRSAYDEKLEVILRSAAAIFAEQGYHQASIRAIARDTRISLSGLYYYFQSKEELLFLIQDHALGRLLDEIERRLEGVEDPLTRIRTFIDGHLRFFAGNMTEMKVLSHEAQSLTGHFRAQVNAKKRRLTEIVTETLAELRPEGQLDLRVSTFALFGMMNWLYNWYRPERDVPVSVRDDNVTRLYLGGFLQEGADLPAMAGGEVDATPSVWGTGAKES